LEPGFAESSSRSTDRNWIPLVVAAVLVAAVVSAAFFMSSRRPKTDLTATIAGADPYAASLPMTEVQMSESSNLAGGKVTYIDGHIQNTGQQTIRAVTVQVLFHNYNHEIAQNQVLPLMLIRMREPYIDTEPVSAEPLVPGSSHDFRLIFDSITPDWAGDTPEIRIIHAEQ
jgi:hypothetical protein